MLGLFRLPVASDFGERPKCGENIQAHARDSEDARREGSAAQSGDHFASMLKARANARNIVGPNMLRAFAHHIVCCCVLLRLVGSCWMQFETGQTSEPTSANISIVSRSSKRGPTVLRSFAQYIQQCCAGARALHATYPHKYMRSRKQHGYCVPESFIFSS